MQQLGLQDLYSFEIVKKMFMFFWYFVKFLQDALNT